MMRFALAASLAFGALGAFGVAAAATLTLRIENVTAGGILRVGVYDSMLYKDDNSDPIAFADVPAQKDETTILLKNIPPGFYAVETYLDVNANDRMDRNWLGLPLEPYGFSRDARPYFGKPSFERVKIEISEGDNSQVIHLQRFLH